MALTGQNIADRARRVLQDSPAIRWLDAEVLDWINDAQREIVTLKPNANSVAADLVLAISETKQSLPTGGLWLFDVVRNSSGRAVRRIDRSTLDAEEPTWHASTANASVRHFLYDEATPTIFWVYPKQPATAPGTVHIVYSKLPTDLANLAGALSLSDMYAANILDYVCYRCYLKDSDNSGNAARAASHISAFTGSLGARVQVEGASSPNARIVYAGGNTKRG